MIHNYMLADIASTTGAVMFFAIVFLPPGFLVGSASDVLGFRHRSATEKVLLSLVLSAAVSPILAVTVARVSSITAAVVVFILLALAGLALLWNRLSVNLVSLPRETKIALAAMALWAIVAILSVSDLQWGTHLYTSAALFDHSIRIPIVAAVSRSGVPPRNPFYGIGSEAVLRYYYYWYVICALPVRIGLSARACFNAGIVWAGFALAALVPLYLKHFFHEIESLKRKSLIGISLLLVTGLDLIPYALMWVYVWKRMTVADMEWWDPNQVTSWFDSLIWVPHHIAALVACMTGFLLLSALDDVATVSKRCWIAAICGAAFASTAGLSVFVAFVFAVFAVPWATYLLLKRQTGNALTCAAAGILALILSLPFLADLRNQSSNVGHRFVIAAIRDLPMATEWLRRSLHNHLLFEGARVAVLILLYFVELGFFFIIGILQAKRELLGGQKLTTNRVTAWALFASSLLVVSVLQSDPEASGGNDLGFRGILIVQFLLLLWAAPILHDLWRKDDHRLLVRRGLKIVLAATLLAGFAGTAYQALMLRFYGPLADAGIIRRNDGFMGLSPIGERTYLLRDGFAELNDSIPQSFVVQYNPTGPLNWIVHLYSTAQTAAGDRTCGANFGGNIARCRQAMPYLLEVFNSRGAVPNWSLDQICTAFSINVLVATDADPAWGDPNSWVWTRTPIVSNASFRGIPCGIDIRR